MLHCLDSIGVRGYMWCQSWPSEGKYCQKSENRVFLTRKPARSSRPQDWNFPLRTPTPTTLPPKIRASHGGLRNLTQTLEDLKTSVQNTTRKIELLMEDFETSPRLWHKILPPWLELLTENFVSWSSVSLLARLGSAYSLIWGAHEIWGQSLGTFMMSRPI